jgi:predicted RNA-binding Zn ribbon-like protein
VTTHDFQFIAGDLSLDFVNTVGNRLGAADEYFRTTVEVTEWARLAGLIGAHQSLRLTAAHVRAIRATRERLYEIFHGLASGARPSSAAVAGLDAMYARVAAKHRLVSEGGTIAWSWRASTNDPAIILGPVLVSGCTLLISDASAMIRECADDACGWLFLDRSPAARRRWCSMRDCGNRAKARRHYAAENTRPARS